MPTVTLSDVSHRYPSTVTPSVRDVDLHVRAGEFFVLLGSSGSGKSTILRMIHGLETPATGTIEIDGRDVTRSLPSDRDVAIAFESYALYPHMSVAENMGFALRLSGVPQETITERVAEAAARLGLSDALDSRPDQLDGLQRQKVALARALVRGPHVLVMDEPLATLPAETHVEVRDQIRVLQRQLGITTIYATESCADAVAVADRIAEVRDGTVTRVLDRDDFAALDAA
ncbi:ABC transporter ATP-binding protein [Brevibacterium litoralis]|uniref:ABC transporter ATP-binding protein n=1 Tax=Brevibacterium litoralis TaxID=3138935 RepID=UPI0032EC7835